MSDLDLSGIDPAVLQMILAANNYGSGAGFLGADENPYQRADQRLNFNTDILRSIGLYPDDLLGLGDAPEAPGDAPVPSTDYFQSDLRGVYAGNPLISEAFAEIEAGADPFAVSAWIMDRVEKNPELEANLPMLQDSFGGAQTSQQAVQSLLSTFATDVQKERRTRAEVDAENRQAADVFNQKADAYNDYYQPTDQLSDLGFDSVDQFADRFTPDLGGRDLGVGGRLESQGVGPLPVKPTGLADQLKQQLRDNQSRAPHSGATLERSLSNIRPSSIENPRGNNYDRFIKGIQDSKLNDSWMSQVFGEGSGGNRAADSAEAMKARNTEDRIRKLAETRASRLKANTRESQAEKDNKKRLQFAYAQIFGETPPV